jgi:hypothetical protein
MDECSHLFARQSVSLSAKKIADLVHLHGVGLRHAPALTKSVGGVKSQPVPLPAHQTNGARSPKRIGKYSATVG